jgi:hypothetical protein
MGDPYLGSIYEISFLFEEPFSPHEEVPAISLEPEVHLDDVIERIEKMSVDEKSSPDQSTKKPGPFQKVPPSGS